MRRLIAGNISALDLQLLFDSIVPEALVVVIAFAIVVGVVELVVVVIVVEMVVTLPVQICISKSGNSSVILRCPGCKAVDQAIKELVFINHITAEVPPFSLMSTVMSSQGK